MEAVPCSAENFSLGLELETLFESTRNDVQGKGLNPSRAVPQFIKAQQMMIAAFCGSVGLGSSGKQLCFGGTLLSVFLRKALRLFVCLGFLFGCFFSLAFFICKDIKGNSYR